MSWFAPAGLWRRRALITVDTPGTSPVDVNITIPREWDAFWENIDTAGNNLRLVWYDGQTVLTYAIDDGSGGGFSKANRLGRFQIDGMVVPTTASMLAVWVYWDPSSNQSAAASAVTITSARNGYIEVGSPGQHRYIHKPQTARARRPRNILQKTANEQVFVWIKHRLSRRASPGNRSNRHEEPLFVTMQVQDNAAADQATMYDLTLARWVETPLGELWLRVLVKAGTTNTNYTAVVLTRTILPGATAASQQLETRLGIAVGNTLEP